MEKTNYMSRRVLFSIALVALVVSSTMASEVILSAENLNASLKQIQRLQAGLEDATQDERPGLLFQLGVTADDLAMLLTNEVIVYDMQQRGLIDLAMQRTEESGVAILWFPEKKRFIYDGAAFREYLEMVREGDEAAEGAFRLLEIEFFQSDGNDIESLLLAAEHKKQYLLHYPDYSRAAEAGILLAVDYRDLWRLYRDSGDHENAQRYGENTLTQFQQIAERYPGTREARIAEGLFQRFEAELLDDTSVTPDNTGGG